MVRLVLLRHEDQQNSIEDLDCTLMTGAGRRGPLTDLHVAQGRDAHEHEHTVEYRHGDVLKANQDASLLSIGAQRWIRFIMVTLGGKYRSPLSLDQITVSKESIRVHDEKERSRFA